MASPTPRKPSKAPKIIFIMLVLFAVAAAGYGYFSQTSNLAGADQTADNAAQPTGKETLEPLAPSDPLFSAKPGEIIVGNVDAPATIIEYSSLSCPHCAHFHESVLPDLKKQYLDTGKAKLVWRHFPLNEPALRASQLVECAGGDQRLKFGETLYKTQKNWAFSENFKSDLKTIAKQGGIDSAAFDSCLSDKEGEDAILESRQAGMKAGVDSTPSFFVNGVKLDDWSSAEAFGKAIAQPAQEPAAEPVAEQAPAKP
jgi:protein-disulfide isomerase